MLCLYPCPHLSVCFSVCLPLYFSYLLFVYIIFTFIPFFLSSYSWFFGFLLSMSGRSSNEGLKEDKEVSPLNSPSHKGRFQVGPLLWALSLCQPLLHSGQNIKYVWLPFIPSGDSSTSLLSPKGYNIRPCWYSQESGTLFCHQGGDSEGGLAERQLPCVS